MKSKLSFWQKKGFEKARRSGNHEVRRWLKKIFDGVLVENREDECIFKVSNGVYLDFYTIRHIGTNYVVFFECKKFSEEHESNLLDALVPVDGYVDERLVRKALFNIYHDPTSFIHLSSDKNILNFEALGTRVRFNVETGEVY